MAEDASSKKFLMSKFNNYRMLGSHLRIEESLRAQEIDKPKSNNVVGSSVVNMVEHNNSTRYNDNKSKRKHQDNTKANPSKKSKLTGALDKFKVFKTEVELQQGSLIKRFRTDRGGEYMDTLYFQSVGIIYETTAPYTPQQNGISERKNRVLKEMVNSMLSYSGMSQRFWGEAMLTACYLLNRVPNKRNKIIPYELWTKKKPNLNYLRVWGCRAVVRLPNPKLKTLGKRGIECIFVGYVEHSKAFRFYIIEPNDSVAINSIIESRDAIFDEHRFLSVPRPSQRSLVKGTGYSGGSVVSERVTDKIVQQSEPRKSKRHRTPKDFGPEFQLYL
ncbi:zinc finger, CCHC-type containing protein, partial [Tanacetum coccineum]